MKFFLDIFCYFTHFKFKRWPETIAELLANSFNHFILVITTLMDDSTHHWIIKFQKWAFKLSPVTRFQIFRVKICWLNSIKYLLNFYYNFYICKLHVTHTNAYKEEEEGEKKLTTWRHWLFGYKQPKNNNRLALVLMNSSRINHCWHIEAFLRYKRQQRVFFCWLLNGDKYPSSVISTHPL